MQLYFSELNYCHVGPIIIFLNYSMGIFKDFIDKTLQEKLFFHALVYF